MKYRTIVVDPPWAIEQYGGRFKLKNYKRKIPYPMLSKDEIRGGIGKAWAIFAKSRRTMRSCSYGRR